ncbi:MAG: carbohydrate ABC transporter permease [Tetrasphaera jenkinsii]|jgi:alpha-glucoside transport system permease protein|uniref:Binding-protein-dependent transport systems inner membrane component n=1 Tax=Nostocoides jenkinsii Ben 74 TaxID=1193518 RepID=A0A077MBG8_9MICO|nr:carbohydrate ABC transporter permease [Tetrasphaera jenkinsii]MCI1262787.1 carbohydrate ABC transporter permease [Tetrasphaera jenkinsii]CCI53220.1 Binding-protein-dependent transport systems inner membrane component [Tetrasphaera jenkinsii Ben 74]
MTTTVQPGTGTPDQVIKQSKPGSGAGSATPIVRTVLFLLCCLWMLPVFGLLISSFRTRTAQGESGWWTAIANPLDFTQWTLNNYAQVLGDNASGVNMGKAFINSFVVTVPATIIPILIAAFAAYAFTFMEWKGRDVVFVIIVGLLVVPNQVALVPLLKLYKQLDLNGTFLAVWLAHIGFGMPLAVYILRNYMAGLPKAVIESAKIDGASHFTTFWKLIMPMSTPALASFAIFQFLWVWNDLLVALIFLGRGDNTILTVALQGMQGQTGQGKELIPAAGFITILVPIVVFLALQRFFIRGMTSGAVKG